MTAELSFDSGTPTIFLPPSNNSQYLQLDQFIQKNLAIAHVHLADLIPRLEMKGVSSRESTQIILKQLNQFEESEEIQKNAGERINKLVQERNTWSEEFILSGKKFIKSLGDNGAKMTVQSIQELLSSKGFR